VYISEVYSALGGKLVISLMSTLLHLQIPHFSLFDFDFN